MNDQVDIVVVGVGAMGSLFAGQLAKAGFTVASVDINQTHLDAVNAHGLHLSTFRCAVRS